MEGLVGLMEMILTDPSGRFLLAFRLMNQPGRPLVQVAIPYLAVNDQGQAIGELRRRLIALTNWSYELWSQGEAVLTVPSASRSKPYPLLHREAPVGLITETRPVFGRPSETIWTIQFSAPCQRLPALALVTYVALNRGATGIPAR
jgi:hypothetical protein